MEDNTYERIKTKFLNVKGIAVVAAFLSALGGVIALGNDIYKFRQSLVKPEYHYAADLADEYFILVSKSDSCDIAACVRTELARLAESALDDAGNNGIYTLDQENLWPGFGFAPDEVVYSKSFMNSKECFVGLDVQGGQGEYLETFEKMEKIKYKFNNKLDKTSQDWSQLPCHENLEELKNTKNWKVRLFDTVQYKKVHGVPLL